MSVREVCEKCLLRSDPGAALKACNRSDCPQLVRQKRDIVERLRSTIVSETPARYPDVIAAAITEIEQLRTEHEKMRRALIIIAADATDGLQRTQAIGALTTIG